MKGLVPLFLGIFGTFAFSWVGLTVIPTWQIGHLNPESDEEGTDIYPQPQSGMFERGAHVYAANGCVYCHSEQVRADYAANDIERGWGNRRSAPVDYIFERPVFLGKMRMGQDLANIGARAPTQQESPAPAAAASPAASPGPSATSPAPGTSPSAQASPAAARSGGSPRLHLPQSGAGGFVFTECNVACRPTFQQVLLRLRTAWCTNGTPGGSQSRPPTPKLRPRRGRSRQRACRHCILPPGIMCISMRRAASISIRTCHRIGSFTRNGASLESAPPMHCNFPVRMRHPQAGRLFRRTMQNVWLPI